MTEHREVADWIDSIHEHCAMIALDLLNLTAQIGKLALDVRKVSDKAYEIAAELRGEDEGQDEAEA